MFCWVFITQTWNKDHPHLRPYASIKHRINYFQQRAVRKQRDDTEETACSWEHSLTSLYHCNREAGKQGHFASRVFFSTIGQGREEEVQVINQALTGRLLQ